MLYSRVKRRVKFLCEVNHLMFYRETNCYVRFMQSNAFAKLNKIDLLDYSKYRMIDLYEATKSDSFQSLKM